MTVHSDRYHAVWSASSTAANWTCAGRMAMVSISPDDKKSIYAAEGTAAHEVAEKALRGDLDCSKFLTRSKSTSARAHVRPTVTVPGSRPARSPLGGAIVL